MAGIHFTGGRAWVLPADWTTLGAACEEEWRGEAKQHRCPACGELFVPTPGNDAVCPECTKWDLAQARCERADQDDYERGIGPAVD